MLDCIFIHSNWIVVFFGEIQSTSFLFEVEMVRTILCEKTPSGINPRKSRRGKFNFIVAVVTSIK